jgi:N-acetylglucosaminyldiphosphoundecaprenol N-acetyl-beta-D-mannosaminyltransferase
MWMRNSMSKCRILNIEMDNVNFEEFLSSLQSGVVVTPNVDHLIKLQKDEEFYRCYLQAEHVVCDSRIIQILSKILFPKNSIVSQIAGSDLFPAYCQHHCNNSEIKIFLLGGTEETVKIAKDKINIKAKREIVVGEYSPPFGFEKDNVENQKILDLINSSQANVLAVGVGAPKQEKWIAKNREKLQNINLYFAIGATIEFEAGGLKRSPKWMTKFGLEWIYRMFQEPGRMVKRYLVDDIPIIWLLFKQRLGLYKNPWG